METTGSGDTFMFINLMGRVKGMPHRGVKVVYHLWREIETRAPVVRRPEKFPAFGMRKCQVHGVKFFGFYGMTSWTETLLHNLVPVPPRSEREKVPILIQLTLKSTTNLDVEPHT
jgi:hypothetical protein